MPGGARRASDGTGTDVCWTCLQTLHRPAFSEVILELVCPIAVILELLNVNYSL